jgi:dynein heavy chain
MKLTNMQRVSLGAMITLDVHGRDVIETLDNAGVQKVSDFEWAAQLRYYWLESNEAFSGSECSYLVQVENKFRYGCEYLGNTMRLVVTPLTDRIYLTLTGALGMALGGWMSGKVFDLTGSYQAAFINGTLWNLLNFCIAAFLFWRTGGFRSQVKT